MVRAKYLSWMHGLGVVFCVAALITGGLGNPAIGFPIIIAVLIALEVPSSQKPVKMLPVIYGSIKRGGIRRAIFIREMFSIAVIYLGISNLLLGMTAAGIFGLLLGMALVVSSVAGEIEAWKIRKVMAVN